MYTSRKVVTMTCIVKDSSSKKKSPVKSKMYYTSLDEMVVMNFIRETLNLRNGRRVHAQQIRDSNIRKIPSNGNKETCARPQFYITKSDSLIQRRLKGILSDIAWYKDG